MSRKNLLRTAVAFCLAAGCVGFLVEGSPTEGPVIAGDYIWIQTQQARLDARQAVCNEFRPGDDCVELCMIINNNGTLPMGQFCCVNPSDVGGWDGPEECNLQVN